MFPTSQTLKIPRRLHRGFRLLWQSSNYAMDLQCDPWQLAVEYPVLSAAGLSVSDLRWMLARGLLHHAVETTNRHLASSTRTFGPVSVLSAATPRSCFVLTPAGIAAYMSPPDGDESLTSAAEYSEIPVPTSPPATRQPKWIIQLRELRLGAVVIKQFKLPSPNQVAILDAFEEENWPPRIDDPLPPHPEIDPKRRLHDTVKNLNRNQRFECVRFHGDGTGQGVRWEFVSSAWLIPGEFGAEIRPPTVRSINGTAVRRAIVCDDTTER